MKTTFIKMRTSFIHSGVNKTFSLTILSLAVFISVSYSQTLRIDSVSVDSVWNTDSSWYDSKGIQQNRQSRDCKLSFVPSGKGTVQTFVSLSIDSGKTWAAQYDWYNRLFPCGVKSSLTVRILGGDKPGAAFRITGRQYKPVVKGNPQLIHYPDDLYLNGGLPINDLPVHVGAAASVPVRLQLADSSSKGYSEVVKAYWDAMGDGAWDDSTASLNWTWNTTVPIGEPGQRRAIIAKVRDANGLWSNPETLTVQFEVGDGMLDSTANRIVTLRDSAITDTSSWSTYFFQLSLNDTVTKRMSFDPTIGIGNKYLGSIYSTANSTARAQTFREMGFDPDNDSIIGMEYYLMAKSSAKTNFIAFLGKEGGSIRNSSYLLGIGFDKSDSVKVLWSSNSVEGQEKKNICPINFGKWYKCNVEYNVNNYTATYYIDNQQVCKHVMPSASTFGFNMFVVYRDANGQNGMAPYYFNDFTLYKFQK